MSDRKQATPTAGDGPSFDDSLKELESLVRKLESGDLKLEEALSAFTDGMRLSKACEAQLTKAEARLRELTRDAAGEPCEDDADLPDLGDE